MLHINSKKEDLELAKTLLKEYQAQDESTPYRKENIEICLKNIKDCDNEIKSPETDGSIMGQLGGILEATEELKAKMTISSKTLQEWKRISTY